MDAEGPRACAAGRGTVSICEPAPFGVPPLGGQESNVESVVSEIPMLATFPAPQAIDARPAEAGTPNLRGSWPQLTSMLEVGPLHELALEA
jgi:hypothetical protein